MAKRQKEKMTNNNLQNTMHEIEQHEPQ